VREDAGRKSRLKKHLTVLAVSASLALAPLAVGAQGASAASSGVSVQGTGSVKVTPDTVRLNAVISFVGTSNSAASKAVSTSAAAFRAALKDKKVASKDIQSSNLTIYPEYTWTQEKGQELKGYRASQSFTVLIRDQVNAGAIIDAAVDAAGDNIQVSGVTPIVLDVDDAQDAAREKAVAKAKKKAAAYAKLLGFDLGKILWVSESSSSYNPPIFAMAKASADSAAAPTEIDLGEQDVTVTVDVRWAIK
jgi:uncharacterized protein YggE